MESLLKLVDFMSLGRFGLRNKLSKTLVTTSASQYAKIVFSDRMENVTAELVNEDTMSIVYTPKDGFVTEGTCVVCACILLLALGPSTNVIIALWTTAAARIKLYRSMKAIVDTPGCRLDYTDTDSLIYSTPVGVEPVQLGDFLGQLKDEYPDKTILEYVCAGPKQYGLKACVATETRPFTVVF